jgi:uncharacterized protein YgiM (DUF1202 family)
MQTNHPNLWSHPLLFTGLLIGMLGLAACQPVRDPAIVAAERTAMASGVVAAPAAEVPSIGPAQATIATQTLRVRSLPSENAEVVARVREGETYPVTGISSDGAWIQLTVEEAPDGAGWVSAEFVTLAGDITNIAIVEVDPATLPTAAPTEEATPEPTAEPTAEATPEPTQEPTAEPTEEATPEPTAEPTEEPTPEPTTEPTEEATPEPTAEPTEEATPEATAEPTAEPTEEPTAEPTQEPTAEPTEEPAAELGTVTIVTDLPLRVRSEPTSEVDNKIGNVFNGEVYTVLEVSADSLWVRIETPQFPQGSGWVSAEYATFN